MELIDAESFRRLARERRVDDAPGVLKLSTVEPQVVDAAARVIRYVFSDGTIDRAGDTIDPAGWELPGFNKNPVVLWAHDSSQPPVGVAENVGVRGGRLIGDVRFASADVYPFADTIYRLCQKKFIRAVSVGFLPLEWAFVNEKDRPNGIDFTRQELLEISLVPVPCNANALQEARALGIDIAPLRAWAERMRDGGPMTWLEGITAREPSPSRSAHRRAVERRLERLRRLDRRVARSIGRAESSVSASEQRRRRARRLPTFV